MPAGSSRAMLRATITRDETRHGTESQTAPLSRRPCAAAGAWHRHGLGSAGIPRPARHRPAAGLYRLHRAQRGDRRMRLYRSLCRRADGRPHPTWRRSGARTSIPTTARFASRRCMTALSSHAAASSPSLAPRGSRASLAGRATASSRTITALGRRASACSTGGRRRRQRTTRASRSPSRGRDHAAVRSQTATSTRTGTWSEARSHPRADLRMVWDRSPGAKSGLTQTWSSRRPRSAASQSRAR